MAEIAVGREATLFPPKLLGIIVDNKIIKFFKELIEVSKLIK
ncbi:hypothetical protein [Candidatus Cetobacterium colombiensis]|uniref:Uncharacterized protein n=1 Tax=Candidatus Cetobacterium colombiensis TaxID=3073100 RepID=A0ABU4WGD8_9FUSO|nr:hypothetical protein [Candidatus Cetobacterium colombiensis]MDX8337538.1 hypothetical protein [Candidatus Cetobacterium colombiensis]